MGLLKSTFGVLLIAFVFESKAQTISNSHCNLLIENNPENLVDGFDFPVGKPDAKGYYNAQGFRKNNHLGEDWNGTGGGNSDLGDPIYASANGKVVSAKHEGQGWGNVIRIIHIMKVNNECKSIETVYAHLLTMSVKINDIVKRGQNIGNMGNADGAYPAHLHFEIRTDCNMELGGGYAIDATGFINPTDFIKKNR